jgi:hypothetical protein
MELKEVLRLLNALKSCIAISWARGKFNIKILGTLVLSSIVTMLDKAKVSKMMTIYNKSCFQQLTHFCNWVSWPSTAAW